MEVLWNVLGVEPEAAALVDGDRVSTLEVSTKRDSGDKEEVWEELQMLLHKQQVIESTVKDVIPPLKVYINGYNNQLSEFTRDLDFIKGKSSELKRLLEKNSVKLAKVSPYVNDLLIPPSVVSEMLNGKINAQWQENIAFIRDKKEMYAKYKNQDNLEVPNDFKQLLDILDILVNVILERSKKFIIQKIKKLRSVQPVPSQRLQEELLQVKEIFVFIVDFNVSLALELRQAYLYTMRWYYKSYFARYIRSLTILGFKNIDARFALGNGLSNTSVRSYAPSSMLSNYLTAGYSKNHANVTDNAIQDYFQIKKRLSLLTQEDNTVMVSQIAENNSIQNYIEIGFKNLNLAILDNCSVEYNFLTEFFQVGQASQEVQGILEQIFQPTFDQALEYTKQLISQSYDIFGVLISIRVSQQLQYEAKRRKIPVIENYLERHMLFLWPKFQQLIDFQCESLRNVAITTNTIKLPGSSGDAITTPHEFAVQFSKFLTSLLTLAVTHSGDIDERSEPLYNSILRIRNDFETVMTKCSKKTQAPEQFLATNYMYLCNTLQQQQLTLESDPKDGIPLIILETEEHYMSLVKALTEVT